MTMLADMAVFVETCEKCHGEVHGAVVKNRADQPVRVRFVCPHYDYRKQGHPPCGHSWHTTLPGAPESEEPPRTLPETISAPPANVVTFETQPPATTVTDVPGHEGHRWERTKGGQPWCRTCAAKAGGEATREKNRRLAAAAEPEPTPVTVGTRLIDVEGGTLELTLRDVDVLCIPDQDFHLLWQLRKLIKLHEAGKWYRVMEAPAPDDPH